MAASRVQFGVLSFERSHHLLASNRACHHRTESRSSRPPSASARTGEIPSWELNSTHDTPELRPGRTAALTLLPAPRSLRKSLVSHRLRQSEHPCRLCAVRRARLRPRVEGDRSPSGARFRCDGGAPSARWRTRARRDHQAQRPRAGASRRPCARGPGRAAPGSSRRRQRRRRPPPLQGRPELLGRARARVHRMLGLARGLGALADAAGGGRPG